MDLRELAAKSAIQAGLDNYPEYNPSRIYGGVTRSTKRWSFLPHPKKFNGQTVNPMHGLAVYTENGEFLGISQKRHLPAESKIIYEGLKPLFVII